MIRLGAALTVVALALVGCERANMEVCSALPASEDVTSAAYEHPSNVTQGLTTDYPDPQNVTREDIVRGAQRDTLKACLRRSGYLLAQAAGSTSEIAAAAMVSCRQLMDRELRAYPSPEDPVVARRVDDLRRNEYQGYASTYVVEARAGRCWAQTAWWQKINMAGW